MKRILIVVLLFLETGARAQKVKESMLTAEVRPALYATTMVMVHDVVNPPAAGRYYAYMMLAAYDLVASHDAAMVSPGAFIQHYPVDSLRAGGIIGSPRCMRSWRQAGRCCLRGICWRRRRRNFWGSFAGGVSRSAW